jgi:hypothetical protein
MLLLGLLLCWLGLLVVGVGWRLLRQGGLVVVWSKVMLVMVVDMLLVGT